MEQLNTSNNKNINPENEKKEVVQEEQEEEIKEEVNIFKKYGINIWETEWWQKNFFDSALKEKKKKTALNNKEIEYTTTYLNLRLTNFLKKEENFKNNWLDLYEHFNKDFSKIIYTPIYIKNFFSNFDYINQCIIHSEWDEIMEIYKKIVKDNPNYKNSRLDDPKPIYDRRYILLITYHIFILVVYSFSAIFYSKLSTTFMDIKKTLDIEDDENSSFVVLIAYVLFILGLYYGGIEFIYSVILLLFKVLYYIGIILYYVLYYLGWLLFILLKLFGRLAYKTSSAMTGGKKTNKKMKGGGLYEDFEKFINEIRAVIDDFSIQLVVNVLNKFFENILPDEDTFETACKSTSNIEKMLAKQNSKRNTEEPIDINKKINEKIIELLPEDIKKTDFARCMLKKNPPPPPPKCN